MHQLGDAPVDLLPLVVRHHRRERRRRQLEREVALLGVADVDDRAVGAPSTTAPAPTRKRATSSIGFCVADRPMRTSGSPRTSRLQPLEREREVAAALARGDGVDLVDDHRAHASRASRGPRPSRAARRATRASSPGCAAASSAPAAARAAGVSPVRTAVRISTSGRPSARQLGADAGERRLEVERGCRSRAPSAARRRRPSSRRRRPPGARPSRTRPSSAARNAVSVLPEPVGAATSVWRPARIAGQAARLRLGRRRERAARTSGRRRDGSLAAARQGEGRAAGSRRRRRSASPIADRSAAPSFKASEGPRFSRDPVAPLPTKVRPTRARATARAVSVAPPARPARPGCVARQRGGDEAARLGALDECRERCRRGLAARGRAGPSPARSP